MRHLADSLNVAATRCGPFALLRASMARTAFGALRDRAFVCFVLVFGVIAAAQLGFTPAAYGTIALRVGFTNLISELACSALAVRTSTRLLAFEVVSRSLALNGSVETP